MAALIVLCVLAAFGVLSVLWVLFGFLLPGQQGTVMVHLCRGREEAAIRRYRWLRDVGLLHSKLILVDSVLNGEERERLCGRGHDVEFCGLEELSARLEQERKRFE